jgi:hypothetical protein
MLRGLIYGLPQTSVGLIRNLPQLDKLRATLQLATSLGFHFSWVYLRTGPKRKEAREQLDDNNYVTTY